MKKNLLLTTAIVAFAMPAWAEIFDNYNGSVPPITEGENTFNGETIINTTDVNRIFDLDSKYNYLAFNSKTQITLNSENGVSPNDGIVVGLLRHYGGKAEFTGDTNITTQSTECEARVFSIQSDTQTEGESTVLLNGNTTLTANSVNGEAFTAYVSGNVSNLISSAPNLTVNGYSKNGKYAQPVTVQYGATIELKEGTNTTINATADNGASYAIAAQEYNKMPGQGGTLRSFGNLTVNANSKGEAYGIYAANASSLNIAQLTATANSSSGNAYGVGVLSNTTDVTIGSEGKTSTLTGNGAKGYGLYINQSAGANLNGNATVSGSTSDIHNDGTLNVNGDLTLAGTGITGTGTTTFESGSKLTVQANKTTIANSVINEGATLSMVFDTGFTGDYQLITGSLDEEFTIAENSLYEITTNEDAKGTYTISKKSSEEIADSLGLSSDEASALTAATSSAGSSGNASFDEVVSQLNQAAQAGDSSVAKEASKLGADTNPVVASQEASSHDVLFSIVSNELNGAGGAIAEGKSSGDFFKKATAWVRGLFNKADHESTSKSAGFNSDTYGVAFGIDKELDNNVRAGFGYANSQTDIESVGRDTDVDTNSLFVYAKYKPADWYVNTMLAYSWSEYDEKKSILGVNAGAKYDVDTIALQSMYGYETKFKEYDLTPEFGFRYLHIDQDSYTDKLGSKVASNQEDVLTLVAGAKIAKDYTLDNGTILRPELKAALTYDLFDADNSANVLLANGAGYTVDGEKLDRLGFELGAKVSTFATEKTELSAGYLTRFREDYQDHTLTFDVKYNF